MSKHNYEKTIADAQAFIDSIKEFNGGTLDESGSDPVSVSGGNPFGSDNYPSQSNLDEKEKSLPASRYRISSSLAPAPNNGNGSRSPVHKLNSNQSPVPKLRSDKSFPEISFSRNQEYENPFRADLLTFIEVYYHENRKLPDEHILHEHFALHPERPNFLKGWKPILDTISQSLSNRGIKPYNTVENYIDPKFAYATSLIVNHLDKRTIPAKLKEAGLTTKEWQAFLRRKRHYEYFQSRLDEVFDNDVKNSAKISLSRMIENGDLQAIKYYNELKNIYRPETQSALQMVSIVLTAVMEVLAQHVTSEVLNRVAAEIRTTPSVRKIIETSSS